MAVLRGAQTTILRDQPHLFIEVAKPDQHRDVASFLEPLGYREVARYCVTPTYHFAYG